MAGKCNLPGNFAYRADTAAIPKGHLAHKSPSSLSLSLCLSLSLSLSAGNEGGLILGARVLALLEGVSFSKGAARVAMTMRGTAARDNRPTSPSQIRRRILALDKEQSFFAPLSKWRSRS